MKRYQVDGGIPTLAAALSEHMLSEDLKRLAALTKEKLPTRKADLAAVIMRHLDGERLRTVWQCLDELQRAAVAEVVHSSATQFLADRFRAKYGRDPNWGTTDKNGYQRSPSALGFFFYGNVVMPADLKERLKAFVPPPAEVKIETLAELPAAYVLPFSRWNSKTKTEEKGTEEVPLTVRETQRTAQRELLSVLRLVDAGKVAVSDKTRRPLSTTIDAITSMLEGGDYYPRLPVSSKWHDENAGPIRAFAWPLLIQAGGLAQLSGSKLQLTKAGRKALAEPAAETIRTIWTKWEDTTIIDELSRIDCVKGQTGKGKRGLTAVSSRRVAIADTLAECPVGGWISIDEFFRFLRALGNDFAVTRNAWNLYISELQYGSLGYEGGGRILEERYLYCLLLEYAATLGLIDVALIPPAHARGDYHDLWGTDDLAYFSRYDGLMYFRVTPLGSYCLGAESGYQPTPVEVKPVLRVLPNLEIAAIGAELEQGDRLALDAYATKVSDLVWQLDAGKLLAAIEEGRSVDEIREFLAARSGAPIPDTVARLLADVADRSAKVHDRGLARLIECADPALAALISNDSRTRKHCMRAGERHLVVPASSEAAFKRTLREVGYLLAMGEARPAKNRRVRTADHMTPQAAEE
ncbi:MAG: hypothetical protein A2Y74_04050 [Actinobacteria bacterium RBG_13_63_9]|nr:MAG: hypothetical protein A2Y74_04050 [Actinobacteria bacterium RBG_13_63_9]